MDEPIRLLLFAKAPVPGRVKTRLRTRWGSRGACFWYRRMLEATLANTVASGLPVELWCSPGAGHPFLRSLARRHGVGLRSQAPGDLGRRMWRAAADTMDRGAGVLIVGADCTPLTPDHLRRAAAELEQGHDLVLIPAGDGGYVLVGLTRPVAAPFRAVSWGTARVLRQTRLRARRARLRLLELPASWDVDRPEDVQRLCRQGLQQPWSRHARR